MRNNVGLQSLSDQRCKVSNSHVWRLRPAENLLSPMTLSPPLKCLFIAALLLMPEARAVVLDYNSTSTSGWATRINLPDDLPEIRGLVIIGNGAGGSSIGDAENAEYVAFARAHGFGIMAFGRWGNLYSTTERNRFLAALADFAKRANRPELVNVPWVAFGFSQGGGQAYSLNFHFPTRTIAMGLNKTGTSWLNFGYDTGRLDQAYSYYHPDYRDTFTRTATSPLALKTPALLVAGANDDAVRRTNMTNAFNANRAAGAPWAFLVEEATGHDRGRAYRWFLPFLAEAIALRYPEPLSAQSGAPTLLDVTPTNGWLIDRSTQASGLLQAQSQASFGSDPLTRGWVPSEATARRAQAFGSYFKLATVTAGSTTTSPVAAPLDLAYGLDLSGQTSPAWTKIEFFDSAGKLGELLAGAGSTPTWTRRLTTTTGFVSTYGLVARADGSQRYTQLETLWVNGGSGFALAANAPEATWSYNSTGNNTGNISGSWGTASNWRGNTVPGGQNQRVDFSAIDYGATSSLTLDGARTAGYLQFGDALGGQWTSVSAGTGGSLALDVSAGSAVIQIAPGSGQTVHFANVSPTGSDPLELVGNGNPGGRNALLMNLASDYSGSVTVRNALRWDVAPSSTAFGTTDNGTSIEAGSALVFREWSSGAISVPEPFTFAGLGQPGLPALRVGTANNSTVTLTGALTLSGPVALGVASSANGIGFTLNGTITSLAATDRSLYLGYLQSQVGDATLPGGTRLNTTGLDDAAGVWGATTFGAGVSYPGLAPDRVVLGLGDFRLVGAHNRLPIGARLVLNTAAATDTAALRMSKLTLNGYSQEVAGIDSYVGSNSGYTMAVVGGSAISSSLVVNTPSLAVSSYAGALGGAGANENNLSLEKKGPGTLNLTGTLGYTGATLVSGGTLALGSGVGTLGTASLTVEPGAKLTDGGALTLPETTILRRSTVSGEAAVQVAGALTHGGSMTVELPGYIPVLGDVIPLLSAGSISGGFTAVVVPRVSSGLAYRLERGATAVNLRVVGTSFDATLYRAGLLSATASVSAALITADSDGDGLPDLLDYALGGSLSAPDAAPAPELADGQLRISFTRDARVPDVTLQVEASSALDAGTWTVIAENIRGAGWTGPAQVSETATGDVNRKQVTVTDPGTGSRRFLRLKAVYQP